MKTGVNLLSEPQHSLWERREGACVSEAEAEQQRARKRMRGGCRLPPSHRPGGEKGIAATYTGRVSGRLSSLASYLVLFLTPDPGPSPRCVGIFWPRWVPEPGELGRLRTYCGLAPPPSLTPGVSLRMGSWGLSSTPGVSDVVILSFCSSRAQLLP